jgi:hypothetical protein
MNDKDFTDQVLLIAYSQVLARAGNTLEALLPSRDLGKMAQGLAEGLLYARKRFAEAPACTRCDGQAVIDGADCIWCQGSGKEPQVPVAAMPARNFADLNTYRTESFERAKETLSRIDELEGKAHEALKEGKPVVVSFAELSDAKP